jgi:CRP-like cAMP-binding protein
MCSILVQGEPRSASTMARTYCELFRLDGDDFEQLEAQYPELREVMKAVAAERSEKVTNWVLEGIIL